MQTTLERLQALEDRMGRMEGIAEEVAKLRGTVASNHGVVLQLAEDVRALKAGGGGGAGGGTAPPSVAGAAALEKDAIVGVVNEAIQPEMGKLGARVKSVEVSVKAFSERLGNDVEVWQAAVNSELQAALGKVKEQLKLHGDDVEVLKKNQVALAGAMEHASASDKEALGRRVKGVEDSVKAFSAKLGGDVEVWQKQFNAELQAAVAKLRENVKSNHEEVSKLAEDVGAIMAGRGRGGGGEAATAAGGAGAGAASDVAAMGKKIKAVEESVKSFSTKLGEDVEAWQRAVNAEMQAALTKVKDQVHRNAEVVGKCQRDVEALAAGRPPSPEGGKEHSAGGGGSGSGSDSGSGAEKGVVLAMGKRIKVLEATLSAHEMALQAHTETLEAHASWLENIDNNFEDEGQGGAAAAPAPAAAAAPAAAPKPKPAEDVL